MTGVAGSTSTADLREYSTRLRQQNKSPTMQPSCSVEVICSLVEYKVGRWYRCDLRCFFSVSSKTTVSSGYNNVISTPVIINRLQTVRIWMATAFLWFACLRFVLRWGFMIYLIFARLIYTHLWTKEWLPTRGQTSGCWFYGVF